MTLQVETEFRSDAPEGYFLTSDQKKTFQTEYELLEVIGSGSFSQVKQCRHRHTGKLYAVKVSKRNSTREQVGMRDDEIQILVAFGQHPNIITVKVSLSKKSCRYR